jgi:hypothetical protein
VLPIFKMELTDEEEDRLQNSYRCNGDMICDICGKSYDRHPLSELSARVSYDGVPFLNELCNGELVKL